MTSRQPQLATKEAIYRRVQADLEPSVFVTQAKIGGAVGLGGLASLFLCGQLGFGLSSAAMAVHTVVMDVAGFMGCTAVCAVLFAVVPVLTLRAISSGIQFFVLIRRWQAIAGWTLAFGSLLAYENGRSDTLWVILLWAAVAVASFKVLARAVHELSVWAQASLSPE
jgi:hypothetical protein